MGAGLVKQKGREAAPASAMGARLEGQRDLAEGHQGKTAQNGDVQEQHQRQHKALLRREAQKGLAFWLGEGLFLGLFYALLA